MILFQFVLGSGISSAAIAWFSSGHFSHVDCVLKDGDLLGSRSDRIDGIEPGVQVRQPAYEVWKDRAVVSIKSTYMQEKRFYAFLDAQLGKPYDSTAIWGFVAGRDWRADDSWFCSELQAAALEAAGIIPALYTPANKVSPVTLCTLLSALGATVEPLGESNG